MRDAKNPNALTLSRRRLLHHAAWAAGGGAGLAAGFGGSLGEAAIIKISHKAAAYQDTPKGKFRCGNCVNWLPPSSCKLVQSPISPNGYCRLYSPK